MPKNTDVAVTPESGVVQRLGRRGGATILDQLIKGGKDAPQLTYEQILERLRAQNELTSGAEIQTEDFTLWEGKAGKRRLVGVPFVIVDWQFNPGDFGREYVSVRLITKHGQRVVINDSSTPGICDFMQQVRASGYVGAIEVPGGVRASKYERKDEDGNPIFEPGSSTPAMGESFWLNFNPPE